MARPILLVASGLVATGLLATVSWSQGQSAAPVARYTMDAGTMSGMGAMGSSGGMEAAMAMMRGGPSKAVAHELLLKLGSSRSATGAPRGDHFMPAGAGLGKSVPLVTPPPGRSEYGPAGMQMPKLRLLLFWGCGEKAGPGQPVVIDFSKMAKGQVPPGLFSDSVSVPEQWQVTVANSTTYGDWPNEKELKPVPANASLLGSHRIASTYAPDINFDLDRDFMAPLEVRSPATPGGGYALSWNGLADATGYYAWVSSAKTDGRGEATDMVWWSSSSTRQFGGLLWDWISPPGVARLVSAGTVMPPSQTACTVPAEVIKAGGEATMGTITAFGPQRDFAYPPRPAKANVAWKPEWIARVRFRSSSMILLGMDEMMAGMNDMGEDQADGASPRQPEAPAKPKCKGLKGIAMRAAGLCQ